MSKKLSEGWIGTALKASDPMAAVLNGLARGLDPNYSPGGFPDWWHALNKEGFDGNILACLLDGGASVLNTNVAESVCSLGACVERNNHEALVVLLKEYEATKEGELALDGAIFDAAVVAVGENDEIALGLLLSAGLDPSVVPESRQGERPILILAADTSNKEAIAILLEAGADIEQRGAFGETALMLAASVSNNHSDDSMLFLLEKGADVRATDQDGWGPLHWIANMGRSKKSTMERLLAAGVPIDGKDNQGATPLLLASRTGDSVKTLLSFGADALLANNIGMTPLMTAAAHGSLLAVDLLLPCSDAMARDEDGLTAAHHAVAGCDPDCIDVLWQGPAITAKSNMGGVPMDMGSKATRAFMMDLLSKREADELEQATKRAGPLMRSPGL